MNAVCPGFWPNKGDAVVLRQPPDGYLSRDYPVTVGNTYEVVDHMGSCIVVTTDVPDETASIWVGRFEPAPPPH